MAFVDQVPTLELDLDLYRVVDFSTPIDNTLSRRKTNHR